MQRFNWSTKDGMVPADDGKYILYSEYEKILYGLLRGQDPNLKPLILDNFTPPFRVGRKQGKAILDCKGLKLGFMPTEEIAQVFCDFLNKVTNLPL